ncbi:site-specific integrase [Haloarcula sp. JP-L23]|uniref:tyrosine-type recombinase/integrase n=1 Tax=Haloarcula sp. JP-L23 TaxID=2716717 RepID=UPI00140F0F3C|nr:site-specific integrase [Haloarcula sp. JP-L23]
MAENTDSQGQATVWLEPGQVNELRTAAHADRFLSYLRNRNETIITLMYDTGLRVGELVQLDVEMFRNGYEQLFLPGHIQKDYPTESSPSAITIELDPDDALGTPRIASSYMINRWKSAPALFPSRVSDRMTPQAVRDMLSEVAAEADVRPFKLDGSQATHSAVTPHALRHSVAYRMLHEEDGYTLYDVRNRLRHRSIQTTERVYDHFRTV